MLYLDAEEIHLSQHKMIGSQYLCICRLGT